MQCTVSFEPPAVGEYHGDLIAEYDTGETAYGSLVGYGSRLDISLSTDTVQLLPTFLSKMNQHTFKIVNRSARPVEFAWKRGPGEKDGQRLEPNRSKVDVSLRRLVDRAAETIGFAHEIRCVPGSQVLTSAELFETSSGDNIGSSEAENSSDEEERLLGGDLARTMRATKRARRDAEKDRHLFEDPVFSVTPLEGVIYPNGEVEVTVQFRPNVASDFTARAFCEVTGLGQRLPLTIRGRGLGPKAVLSYDVLDVGETYINTVHQYEVELQNRGEIGTTFRLLPNASPFGSKFSFFPSEGELPAGRVVPITVQFFSNELGLFSEVFKCDVAGAAEPLSLEFKGRVVGPQLSVDAHELAFGTVAFGFRYQRSCIIKNESEIPLRFNLRVPGDTSGEFSVTPAEGVIAPLGEHEVFLEIEPKKVTKYHLEMAIDVVGVGLEVKRVPITAESAVPTVVLETGGIDFGECFLRHPYPDKLEIVNLHPSLPAKVEALPQDDQSKGLGEVLIEPSIASIEPNSKVTLGLSLAPVRRGRIQLPVRFLVHGGSRDALECVLAANAVGPTLRFEDPSTGAPLDKPSVDFGRAEVLKKHQRMVRVVNPAPIPAEFKTFIETGTAHAKSVFSVEPREDTIPPGGVLDLVITAFMDDTLQFRDVLHLLVTDGEDVHIQLRSSGSGTCLVIEELDDISKPVDLGSQFTGRPFTTEFTVKNMSRRPQQLFWQGLTKEAAMRAKSRTQKPRPEGEAGALAVAEDDGPDVVFQILPDRANLTPGQVHGFVVTGLARNAGSKLEKFLLRSTVGKLTVDVLHLEFAADVAAPLLEFSPPSAIFSYWCDPKVSPAPMQQPMSIVNRSKLPLTFNMRVPAPFTIDRPDWFLEPGGGAEVLLTFDPGYKNDRQSMKVASKMQITYQEAPQKDAVDLVGEVNFPNLEFNTMLVDFGSALIDTVRRRHVTIKNSSKVDVRFDWSIVEYQSPPGSRRTTPEFQKRASPQGAAVAAQAVDILPLNGTLAPGQTETVEFCFFAHPGAKLDAYAMCEVSGGPSYEIRMTGEASTVKYSLDQTVIDIGSQAFDKVIDRDVSLQNTGKVDVDFRVNLAKLTRPGVVSVSPMNGNLKPGQKETLKLKIRPGVPDRLSEVLLLEVAHCESEVLQVLGEGTYPSCVLTLPRAPDELYPAALEEAKTNLSTGGPRMHLSPPKTSAALQAVLTGTQKSLAAAEAIARSYSRPPSAAFLTDHKPRDSAPFQPVSPGAVAPASPRLPTSLGGAGGPPSVPASRGSMGMGDMGLPVARSPSPPVAIQAYKPSQHEIEVEADRIRLCQSLIGEFPFRPASSTSLCDSF